MQQQVHIPKLQVYKQSTYLSLKDAEIPKYKEE